MKNYKSRADSAFNRAVSCLNLSFKYPPTSEKFNKFATLSAARLSTAFMWRAAEFRNGKN